MSRPWAGILVAALAGAVLVWPFAYAAQEGIPIIYNALAADSYYYAALARNFSLHGFFGVDGETVANGYMPLWQLIVAVLDLGFAGSDTPPETLMTALFVVSLGLIAVGVMVLVWFVAQCFGVPFAVLTIPLICPGAAFFALEHAYHVFSQIGLHNGHSMWSFVNGMESGIGLAFFALLLPVAVRLLDPETATHRDAFVAGGLAFLIMMARLDDVFVGIALGMCLLPVALRQKDIRLILRFAMLPLLGTAVYFGVNSLTAGHPLPTSGMLKTELFSFPNRWEEFSGIATTQNIDTRLLPLSAFLLIGTVAILSQASKSDRGWDTPLILMLSFYLVLKAGFLTSSVAVFEQGYWYYTNLFAAVNLLCVLVLARFVSTSISVRTTVLIAPVLLLVTGAAAKNTAEQLKRYPRESYATVNHILCADPAPIKAAIPADSRLIDTGDGVYAFCLGMPAVTLTGLADSASFNDRRNEIGFFAAALEHGHDILVESPVAWASYDWRNELDGHNATLLNEDRGLRVWKITPPN